MAGRPLQSRGRNSERLWRARTAYRFASRFQFQAWEPSLVRVLTLKNLLLERPANSNNHFRSENFRRCSFQGSGRTAVSMIRINNSTATANSYKHTAWGIVTSRINKEDVPCTSAPLTAKISLPFGRNHNRVTVRAALSSVPAAHSPRAD
jgi:hypothetical protein